MNYMPIVPLGMTDLFGRSGINNCFLLAQYWKYPQYREFYSTQKWDTVILDNAVYENSIPVPFEDMMKIAEYIDAEQLFIVAPEDMDDGLKTADLTEQCVIEWGSSGETFTGVPWNLMTILHELPNEMKAQYVKMNERLI